MRIVLLAAALACLAACTSSHSSYPAFDATQYAFVTDSRMPAISAGAVSPHRNRCEDLIVC